MSRIRMILANVIFPAFTAPYLSYFFFPLAAIAAITSEIVVFKLRHRFLTLGRTIGITLAANFVSWMAGIALGFALPSGLADETVNAGDHQTTIATHSSHFDTMVWWSFGVAFLLSILIEYLVWRAFQFRSPLTGLFPTTILAHVASYLLLMGIAFAYIGFGWW